jgi:sugar/nucleoside kinase (ribokinase family)
LTGRVLVVGDLVTDVLARLSGELAPGSDTPARIRITGGGQAANTAAWLAQLGVPVTLVATTGDDPAGRDRVAELVGSGVDCAVRPVAGTPTGTLVVLSSGDDRTMLTDRGAASRLAPGDLDRALRRWPDARHLHLSGYVLLDRRSRAAGRHALRAAAAGGLTTSVDAGSVDPVRRVGPARFLGWLGGVDLLLANAVEATCLAGPAAGGEPRRRGPAAAAAAGAAGAAAGEAAAVALTGAVAVAVVKLGPAGAVWAGRGGVVRVPASPATVLDPTGAGDAFAAGLLAAWRAGAGPAEALRAGNQLGAAAVATAGARPTPGGPPGRPITSEYGGKALR